MRIGELAERAGVSVRALRYYEEQGLLRPTRTANGYRVFADGDVHTVEQVRTLLAAGLGTELIRDILSCMTAETAPLHGCRRRLDRERRRMTDEIDRILAARALLDALLDDDTELVRPTGRTSGSGGSRRGPRRPRT